MLEGPPKGGLFYFRSVEARRARPPERFLDRKDKQALMPVSYTHLTLPTILRV